jgi:hypothetical protein
MQSVGTIVCRGEEVQVASLGLIRPQLEEECRHVVSSRHRHCLLVFVATLLPVRGTGQSKGSPPFVLACDCILSLCVLLRP